MTKRIVATAVVLGASALLSSCNFEQPNAGCIVQDSDHWFVRYHLVENQPLTAGCAAKLSNFKGELLGVFKYTNPKNPEEAKIALRPYSLSQHAAPLTPEELQSLAEGQTVADPVNAVGALPRKPQSEEDNLCVSTNLTVASGDVSAGGDATVAARYEFTNVQVYSAPSAPGTQMGGELTYTVDGCTAKYTFRAIWPFVGCNPAAADACGAGSGLNPDFKVVCDPDALSDELKEAYEEDAVCVAQDPIPSFK